VVRLGCEIPLFATCCDKEVWIKNTKEAHMAKGNSWAECILSLEKVAEGSNRSVILLKTTIEKLGVVMAAIKDAQSSNARMKNYGH
jgi:hypothetical protein